MANQAVLQLLRLLQVTNLVLAKHLIAGEEREQILFGLKC